MEFVLCQASKGNIGQLLLSVSKYLRDLVKSAQVLQSERRKLVLTPRACSCQKS